ncbi:MAG: aldo/keto reductase, partial [Pseudomonadota bacterium]
ADQGIGVIPWSPLARGLLTRDWSEQTERSKSDRLIAARFEQRRDEVIVKGVARLARNLDVPRAQVALAWVLANPVVTAPIIGASKISHVEDAVAALDVTLDDAAMQALEAPYTPRSSSF